MKQLRLILLIILSFLFPLHTIAQENVKIKKIEFKTDNTVELGEAWSNIKEGNKHFKAGKGTYRDAREHYLLSHKYNPDNAELNYKIGICYLFSDDKFESQSYLEMAFVLKEDVSDDIRFMLGKAYHLTLEFDNAIQQYQEYLENLEPNQRAIERNAITKLIQECNNGKELLEDPKRVIISNMGKQINSVGDDYNPIFAPGDSSIYITSRRQHYEKAKRSPVDNKYFEEIYVASRSGEDWDTVRQIGKPVSSVKHNTAAVGLSQDGSILYVYQGHKEGGAIYQSQWKVDKWTSLKNVNSKFKSNV